MKLQENQLRTPRLIKKRIKQQVFAQRRYRAKKREKLVQKKAEVNTEQETTTPTTLQNESKRQYYSKYCREQGSKMSCQKKQAIHERYKRKAC